jgi:hypothetical protein
MVRNPENDPQITERTQITRQEAELVFSGF